MSRFKHIGQEVIIDKKGNLLTDLTFVERWYRGKKKKKKFSTWKNFFFFFSLAAQNSLADHAMDTYQFSLMAVSNSFQSGKVSENILPAQALLQTLGRWKKKIFFHKNFFFTFQKNFFPSLKIKNQKFRNSVIAVALGAENPEEKDEEISENTKLLSNVV